MTFNLAVGQADDTEVTGDSGKHRKRPEVAPRAAPMPPAPQTPPAPAPAWGPPQPQPPYGAQPWGPPQPQSPYGAQPWGPPQPQPPYGAQPWGPPQPQPPYGAQPWGPPQPYGFQPLRSPYSSPPRSSVGHRLTIGALCVVLVAVIGGIVAAAHSGSSARKRSANPLSGGTVYPQQTHVPSSAAPTGPAAPPAPAIGAVTPSSPLGPGSGEQVFSDDFKQASSGWTVGDHEGATYRYGSGGYSISVQGEADWYSWAPNEVPTQQIIMSLTAHESAGAAATSGFGLSCDTGGDSDRVGYEFLVNETGRWFLERRIGPMSATASAVLITRGTSPRPLGSAPLTISAACANLAGNFTRLVFYIDGAKVADMTDGAPAPRSGWLGGLLSSGSASRSSTMTATQFTERAFAAGAGGDPPTGPGPSAPPQSSTPPDPYGPPVSNA